MGFMAIVAFCTHMSAGQMSPVPPYHCTWVEQGYPFETETACMIQATRIADDPIVINRVDQILLDEFGYNEPFIYFTYCIPEGELKDFYRHFGVGDLGDIPEDA